MSAYSEQIVFTPSEDQRAQAGVLIQPTGGAARSVGMVCIHGSPGVFWYPLYVALGRALAQRGYRFVSGHTRGHDIATLDIPWPITARAADFAQVRLGGDGWYRMDEEPRDVAGWIDFLAGQGAKQIVLFGHSGGVARVLYYQAERQDPRVVGLILAGGSDRVTTIEPARLELAERLVAEGQEDALLPVPARVPMLAGMESAARVVHWEHHAGRFAAEGHTPWMASIRVPVLAICGTADDIAYVPGHMIPELHAAQEDMRRRAVQAPRFDLQVIEGADHGFTGQERELAEVVAGWLGTLPGTKGATRRRWWRGRKGAP